jgi:hypothetical protein
MNDDEYMNFLKHILGKKIGEYKCATDFGFSNTETDFHWDINQLYNINEIGQLTNNLMNLPQIIDENDPIYFNNIGLDDLVANIGPATLATQVTPPTISSLKEKPINKLSVSESLMLFSKGFKPYIFDKDIFALREITVSDEKKENVILWLMERMVEKINEKYKKIVALEEEKQREDSIFEAKIRDLYSSISEIREKGIDAYML